MANALDIAEIKIAVFGYLSPRSQLQVRLVSKAWDTIYRSIVGTRTIWSNDSESEYYYARGGASDSPDDHLSQPTTLECRFAIVLGDSASYQITDISLWLFFNFIEKNGRKRRFERVKTFIVQGGISVSHLKTLLALVPQSFPACTAIEINIPRYRGSIQSLVEQVPHIRSLTLNILSKSDGERSPLPAHLQDGSLFALEHISISGVRFLNEDILRLAQRSPRLQKLAAEFHLDLHQQQNRPLALEQTCPNLKHLVLLNQSPVPLPTYLCRVFEDHPLLEGFGTTLAGDVRPARLRDESRRPNVPPPPPRPPPVPDVLECLQVSGRHITWLYITETDINRPTYIKEMVLVMLGTMEQLLYFYAPSIIVDLRLLGGFIRGESKGVAGVEIPRRWACRRLRALDIMVDDTPPARWVSRSAEDKLVRYDLWSEDHGVAQFLAVNVPHLEHLSLRLAGHDQLDATTHLAPLGRLERLETLQIVARMSTAFFKPIRFDWLRSTTRTPWTDPTYSWFTAWISSLTAAQRRTTDVQYLAEVGEKVNLPRLERLAVICLPLDAGMAGDLVNFMAAMARTKAHVRQVRPNVVVRFHRRQRTEFEPMVFHEPLYATPLVSVGPPAYET